MSKLYVVGSVNMDLVIETDVIPDNGVTVSGSGFMTNPGGKGANQAVAVAKSGGNVQMIGCVGDEFGCELADTLRKYNVGTEHLQKRNGTSSGVALVILSGGDNRIILNKGANSLVDDDVVNAGLQDAQEGDYLITQLEIPVNTVANTLQTAKSKGLITVLNPAPAVALPDCIWHNVDYFVPNQSEAEFYTGIYPRNVYEARNVADILLAKGVRNVVITMGSLGAVAFADGATVETPACKVQALDTTAAGDTFVGAMTTMLSEGRSLKDAMTYANKASAITVSRSGAQQSIPYRSEIL